MVSLWPWKGEDSSPASFEKTLSALSEKITKAQLQLDTLNQRSRRRIALWTLYTSFAYILCVIILALVVGWRNWGAAEYTGVAGSPLLMYLVRAAISSYYTYRISTATRRLEEYQLERTKTIDKLKTATKYNSTQQLLEKYGGATPAPKPKLNPSTGPGSFKHAQQNQTVRKPARTSIPPPATANIQRPGSMPSTPQQAPSQRPHSEMSPLAQALQKQVVQSAPTTPQQQQIRTTQPRAEFAPNAFSSRPSYDSSSGGGGGGQWYDRILDVLLGEDETHPKNRVVLLCSHCRLVNGQAPPGVKRVEEVGEWRCFNCGGVNGKDEGKRMVEEIMRGEEERRSEKGEGSEKGAGEDEERREKEASEEVEVEEQIKAGLKEEGEK
ncbi:hypothetical protein V497_06691 [Pseudogymnoascus sp. VKM F-4516 (FW-969)]|nr:hypothetical protein V497_06691 [Pseudogymnoascus sp. VKM F-4516 (FW-969)]